MTARLRSTYVISIEVSTVAPDKSILEARSKAEWLLNLMPKDSDIFSQDNSDISFILPATITESGFRKILDKVEKRLPQASYKWVISWGVLSNAIGFHVSTYANTDPATALRGKKDRWGDLNWRKIVPSYAYRICSINPGNSND